ncbi:MAG: hypothetical protein JO131_07950 [Gammaproteobacteria bacterium]|nr:hypothetical protein [Gammaproteobacteria bacterium]
MLSKFELLELLGNTFQDLQIPKDKYKIGKEVILLYNHKILNIPYFISFRQGEINFDIVLTHLWSWIGTLGLQILQTK